MKLTLVNGDRILAALKSTPERTVKEITEAISKATLTIHSSAQREAPVNKNTGGGNLRQSIRYRLARLQGIVEVNANYAAHVEFGTKPHTIIPRTKKVLANRRTGQFFGKVVHHPGTKANPFLQRAFQRSSDKIRSIFNDAMEKILSVIK